MGKQLGISFGSIILWKLPVTTFSVAGGKPWPLPFNDSPVILNPQCYLWLKALDIYISHPFHFFSLPLWGVNLLLCFVSCLSVLCVFVASGGAYSEWLNPLLVIHSLGKALLNLIIRFFTVYLSNDNTLLTVYWQITNSWVIDKKCNNRGSSVDDSQFTNLEWKWCVC